MVTYYPKFIDRLACVLFVGSLVWSATGLPAAAQTVSADQIMNALAPLATTRGLTAPEESPMSDSDRAFIEGLRHRTRSLTLEESEHVAELSGNLKTIDLEIYFDSKSARITAKAEPQLNELGEALRSPRLRNAVIVIAGHTDARGGDDYNHRLSQRRADAVKKYLVQHFTIPAANVTSVGYGKRHLKNTADPFAAENRRVQVVNTSRAEASR